jgi:4-hydroxy-4-methyl-2-oxoglutarate aldolase
VDLVPQHSIETVPRETLKELERLDSCTVSNAIEQFHVRTRNEGFVHGSVRCIFPQFPPKIGYAATARIRTSSTPISGRYYYERIDWWSYLLTIPAPRFIVAQDVDHIPGLGALFGEIHAHISKALACGAYLTNGAVRDLPGIEAAGFQVFAANTAVSHAYAHIVEFGEAVEIGGLRVKPGDLLHGDQHGVVSIPTHIAKDIPRVAAEILESERELINFCRSPDFSFQKLSDKIQRVSEKFGTPDNDPKQ